MTCTCIYIYMHMTCKDIYIYIMLSNRRHWCVFKRWGPRIFWSIPQNLRTNRLSLPTYKCCEQLKNWFHAKDTTSLTRQDAGMWPVNTRYWMVLVCVGQPGSKVFQASNLWNCYHQIPETFCLSVSLSQFESSFLAWFAWFLVYSPLN